MKLLIIFLMVSSAGWGQIQSFHRIDYCDSTLELEHKIHLGDTVLSEADIRFLHEMKQRFILGDGTITVEYTNPYPVPVVVKPKYSAWQIALACVVWLFGAGFTMWATELKSYAPDQDFYILIMWPLMFLAWLPRRIQDALSSLERRGKQ